MYFFIKKIVFWGLISLLLLNLFGCFLDYRIRKSNIFKVNVLFNKKLPQNIILGSSRSLTGVNTELLSKLTKKKWYNLSVDDTKPETHLLLLRLLVDEDKIPSNLMLQYDGENKNFDSTTFFDNDYRFLPYINSKSLISGYFKNKPNYILFKYLPIFKYIYFNTELFFPSVLLFIKPNYQHRFYLKTGDYSYPSDYVLRDTFKKMENKVIVLNNPFIHKFDSSCKANSIKLFLYTAPMYKVQIKTDINREDYFNFSNLYISASKFSDDIHIAHNAKNDFTLRLAKIFNSVY